MTIVVYDGEAGLDLAYSLTGGVEKVYEANNANWKGLDTHDYHKTCSVIIKVLLERFLNRKVPHNARDLVIRFFKGRTKTN